MESLCSKMGEFNEEAGKAGILKAGQAIQDPHTARTVRVNDGAIEVHDGPFAEIKENIIGWYQIECEDIETAIEWAAKVPNAKCGYGAVEVRPDINHDT
ncbi:YciI family protein [Sulfuriflexus mobilis]|uniref:YciI family protein n=1 Tax=Sulfuriflexus mobilis TaxID=1811807 RepID=UPI0022B2A107|nr:YciI family protein [Sulfuriflexus mobilis]